MDLSAILLRNILLGYFRGKKFARSKSQNTNLQNSNFLFKISSHLTFKAMKTLLFLILGLFCSFSLTAQTLNLNGTGYAQILANYKQLIQDIDNALPEDVKYNNATFRDGTVYYINGKRSGLKLNYHALWGNVSVIQNGDTLLLADDPTITHVRIGGDFYIHDSSNRFMKMVGFKDNATVKLIASQNLMVTKYVNTANQPLGSYPFNKKNMRSYYDSTSNVFFYQNEIVAANKKVFYYLLDTNDQLFAANRNGFLRAFPNYQTQIQGYLLQMAKQHMRIRFSKKADIVKLYNFCHNLQSVKL
jgi:hypothetical protein